MITSETQIVLDRAIKLSPPEKVEVIKRLAESLTAQTTRGENRPLIYGEFKDYPGKPADEEDFRMAEWHPTDEELEA